MKYLILVLSAIMMSGCATGAAGLKGFSDGFNQNRQNNQAYTCTPVFGSFNQQYSCKQ